jgi:hypothetical protein
VAGPALAERLLRGWLARAPLAVGALVSRWGVNAGLLGLLLQPLVVGLAVAVEPAAGPRPDPEP